MDSTMYFFAGSEVCLKVIPVFAVMSSSWGIGRLLHLVDLAPGGGGEGVGWPPWANAKFAERPRSNKDFASCFKSGAIKRVPGKGDRKSTRLNSSHGYISYAVFCLKK